MTAGKRIEKHIRGREATYVAIENDKRRPIALELPPTGARPYRLQRLPFLPH